MTKLCIVTIVDSISVTSMPVNEFVLYRSRMNYPYRQVLVSCSGDVPEDVDIPSDVQLFLVGGNTNKMRPALRQVINECKERNEEIIIHLHAQKSAIKFFLASVGLKLRKKTLFTIHSSYSSRNLKYKLSSCLCSLLSKYSNCVSHVAYAEYSPMVKRIKGERMFAIQNGVDYERVQDATRRLPNHNEAFDMFKVVCIGRMIPIKNQQFLIRLMKHLPETELILIGKEDVHMSALARELGVDGRVKMKGLLPRDEVFRILNECGIYVSASLVEGMPVSVLEAMSVGLIPVLSDIPPHQEVSNGCSLFNTLPLIEKDWLQTIRTYQQLSRQELIGLSTQIKDSIVRNFSLESMHKKYDEIYELLSH